MYTTLWVLLGLGVLLWPLGVWIAQKTHPQPNIRFRDRDPETQGLMLLMGFCTSMFLIVFWPLVLPAGIMYLVARRWL